MNTQEGETNVEFAHTIEEALGPLASKDPKTINAFLTTIQNHPSSRVTIWEAATLFKCNPNQYPEVNDIPWIKKLRQGGLTELEKRHFFDQKAIDEIRDLSLDESETEFSLEYPSPDEALGNKGTKLRRISGEIEALAKFRQGLGSKKGAGPSIGEVPGESSV